eukprot:TRINITY_DN2086_c0_g2_i1.p1 TRINITY_DN2086_c0_g2~~TRINITY_DN2086_c0_g2_i1.p1  ORF type:complete len:492 (+),score=188.14 TRINITY_DN2086_c0_g2_i1:219-1694(+)
MDFETFLACLIKVAEIVYPEVARERKSKAVERLVSHYLLPLKESSASKILTTESLYDVSYDEESKKLLMSIFPILKDIYDIHFGDHFKGVKDETKVAQTAVKQLIAFMTSFDLSKNFVQRSSAIAVLEQLVSTPEEQLTNSKEVPAVFNDPAEDYGCYFTLARFFVFLLWSAVVGFNSIRSDGSRYSNAEKLFFMFARMELSNGFISLYKNTTKSPSAQHTLVPPQDTLAELIRRNPLTPESSEPEAEKGSRAEEQERIAIEMCTDKLQRIFIWYCSVNDNSNTNKMPLYKFLMFLKDADMSKTISNTEAELVFAKVIGTLNDKRLNIEEEETSPLRNTKVQRLYKENEAKCAKMDFRAFYYALTIIARKIYPKLSTSKALITMIEKNVKLLEMKNNKVEKNAELLKEMFEILKEERVMELLGWVSKMVKPYFYAYTQNVSIMGYETFLRFCKDFGIFPDLCNKVVLHSNFYSLAFVNTRIIEGTNPSTPI